MELRKDLKLKYLTGTYFYIDCDDKSADNVFTLIREIKLSRRTKKNWNSSDFVFNNTIAESAFRLEANVILDSLLSEELIARSDDGCSYSITDKGLLLFFTF